MHSAPSPLPSDGQALSSLTHSYLSKHFMAVFLLSFNWSQFRALYAAFRALFYYNASVDSSHKSSDTKPSDIRKSM